MTWVVRGARLDDLGAIHALAQATGRGMTTLPADRRAVARKIQRSVAAFAGATPRESGEYLLVLEDVSSGAVLGTAGVYARVGRPHGFYSYRVSREIRFSRELGRTRSTELLTPSNDYTDATEVGTLAVAPALRRSGAGRLLARSRYLLIAAHRDRFASRVIAEMRGWQTHDGRSPFWEAVGQRFFGVDFGIADRRSAMRGNGFIAELLPTHPICTDLLPPAAKAVVGRPHVASAPAMAMLIAEDFRFEGMVDVFDAGPQVAAETSAIRTIAACRVLGLLGRLRTGDAAPIPTLLARTPLHGFRVALGRARCDADGVRLDEATAAALDAGPGEPLLAFAVPEAGQADERVAA